MRTEGDKKQSSKKPGHQSGDGPRLCKPPPINGQQQDRKNARCRHNKRHRNEKGHIERFDPQSEKGRYGPNCKSRPAGHEQLFFFRRLSFFNDVVVNIMGYGGRGGYDQPGNDGDNRCKSDG